MADDPSDLNVVASRLALILSGVQAASVIRDDETVRTSAAELLAEIEFLQRQGRGAGEPELLWYSHLPGSGAGIWLIQSAAESMLEQLNSSTPDWDRVVAASNFAESGLQQLQDAINGRMISEEETREVLATTVAVIEERLRDKELAPDRRESLTEQLRLLKERDEN